jgi:hypothetical protein
MAELSEAFNGIKFENNNFQSIDYFFTQRNLKEEHEYLDQNMNRKNKQINVICNFLAIVAPQNDSSNIDIDIDIFGDAGYHFKGKLTTITGILPSIMIPLKGDKKLFVHLNYKENKEYISFIEVPKRFQYVDINNNNNKLTAEQESN